MTSIFEQFDAFLSEPFDDVRWWEAESETADELVASFQDSDWIELEQTWRKRPPLWIERLVFALPNGAGPERTVPLVTAILKSCEDRSLGPVANALTGFDDADLSTAVDRTAAVRLESVLEAKDFAYKQQVNAVLRRLHQLGSFAE